MMRYNSILVGADITPNVKSELIDYADLKGLTPPYDNIFFDMVPKSACLVYPSMLRLRRPTGLP